MMIFPSMTSVLSTLLALFAFVGQANASPFVINSSDPLSIDQALIDIVADPQVNSIDLADGPLIGA
jgi:hypothetical protein